MAKDETAARDLRRLWEGRKVQKEYWAIAHGHPTVDEGVIEAPLGRDEASRVAIKDCVRADGAAARTEFTVARRFSRANADFTWLKVRPHTGRKHQIRIHLAHCGHPIVGESWYGGDEDLYLALVEDRLTDEQRGRLLLPHHALHAREVSFAWRGREAIFCAEAEGCFQDFLNGRSSAAAGAAHETRAGA